MWGPGFPGNNPPFAECSAVSTQMQDQGAGTTVLRNILEVRNCVRNGQPVSLGHRLTKQVPRPRVFVSEAGFPCYSRTFERSTVEIWVA